MCAITFRSTHCKYASVVMSTAATMPALINVMTKNSISAARDLPSHYEEPENTVPKFRM